MRDAGTAYLIYTTESVTTGGFSNYGPMTDVQGHTYSMFAAYDMGDVTFHNGLGQLLRQVSDSGGTNTPQITGFVSYSGQEYDFPDWFELFANAPDTLYSIDMSGIGLGDEGSSAYNMFGGNEHLYTITGLSSEDTSRITDASYMFSGCKGLTSVPSNLDLSSATTVEGMFKDCSSLYRIDTAPIGQSKATTLTRVFSGCGNLMSVDLSPLSSLALTNMDEAFSDCRSRYFTNLDISPLNLSSLTSAEAAFKNCSYLTTIRSAAGCDLSSQLTSSAGMFAGCSKLAGVSGTTFDSSHTDGAYARVDGLGKKPGYFTAELPDHNEASVGSQSGDGRTTLKLIQWSDLERGGTLTPDGAANGANPDVTGGGVDGSSPDGLGDNLAFTVPTVVNFVLRADGTLVGPTNATIENRSVFTTRVSSLVASATDPFSIVPNAKTSSTPNAVDITAGPAADPLSLASYLTKGDVATPSVWVMAADGSGDASKVALSFSGHAANIAEDVSSIRSFGKISWFVTPGGVGE